MLSTKDVHTGVLEALTMTLEVSTMKVSGDRVTAPILEGVELHVELVDGKAEYKVVDTAVTGDEFDFGRVDSKVALVVELHQLIVELLDH